MLHSEKWRPLMVTLVVIAAIFVAFFVLEAFSGMGMGFFHSNMMSNVSSWGSHMEQSYRRLHALTETIA